MSTMLKILFKQKMLGQFRFSFRQDRNQHLYTLKQAESGLDRDSIVLAHQIRTLDKARFEKVAGKIINEETKASILNAVKIQLGI